MKNTLDRKELKRTTFTLLELLVVIAIIIILAAMLLPVFSNVRAKGKMTSCRNNLSQLGLSLAMYRGDFDDGMPGWLSNLAPDYGIAAKLLVCPQDYSEGHDGGRPCKGDGGGAGEGGISAADMFAKTEYGIPESALFTDQFRETDDTEFNNNTLVSPRNEDITRCSYMYEFAGVECSWSYTALSGTPTWNEVKQHQLRYGTNEFDDDKPFQAHLFPSIRCFYHWGTMWGQKEYVLNTAFEGSTFPSVAEWEKGIYEGQ